MLYDSYKRDTHYVCGNTEVFVNKGQDVTEYELYYNGDMVGYLHVEKADDQDSDTSHWYFVFDSGPYSNYECHTMSDMYRYIDGINAIANFVEHIVNGESIDAIADCQEDV